MRRPFGANMGICACCTFQPLAWITLPVFVSSILDCEGTSAAMSPGAVGKKILSDGFGGPFVIKREPSGKTPAKPASGRLLNTRVGVAPVTSYDSLTYKPG